MEECMIADRLKNILLQELATNNRAGLYAATQKMMAYNSNRIEGSTLTSEQTASLFDTGTIISNGVEVYKAKDIEEMTGHFRMFNQMLKYIDEPLSIDLIKSYHYQLKNGVFEDMANGYPIGEFKNRQNGVSDLKTSSPAEVSEQIESLLKEYESSTHGLKDIAKFHAKYEKIHPFQDGNGRTGRMIMIKQCLDSHIVPVIIRDEDKLLYYKALHLAQTEEQYDPLRDFFAECQKKYLEEIGEYLLDPVREFSTKDIARVKRENRYLADDIDG